MSLIEKTERDRKRTTKSSRRIHTTRVDEGIGEARSARVAKPSKAKSGDRSAKRSKADAPSRSKVPARQNAASVRKAKSAKPATKTVKARKALTPIDPEDLLGLSSEVLLRRWVRSRRTEWRDALIERHLPDVADVARTLSARLPRSVDVDDLCNAGYGGLLRCLETFNAGKGRSFVSYLKTRVYGAMVDELRAMDWLPRLMRSRLAQRDAIVEQLRQDLGREPSDEEVSDELGVTLSVYRQSYPPVGVQATTGFSSAYEDDIDVLGGSIIAVGARGRGSGDDTHPLTALYHRELLGRVEELCSTTEWRLVDLHYLQGMKLRDVAHELRLSPARICQIHARVLQRLKDRLREEAITI
ncbi:MAG: sigma-70 family RNA polymerase sigma factor [Planctomycetes bacterium]|nr:sigma-70 family RNA polymerase sigma factor [Planctomycetota bacterium]